MAKKFPDLNKDGEITQADVLMGRGVDLDRDDKAMGSLMVPREGFGIGSIASKAAREVMKKFASKKKSKAADEPADGGVEEGIDIDLEQQEELLSTRNGDALYFSKERLKALREEEGLEGYAEMMGEFAAIREVDDEIIEKGTAVGYDKEKIKRLMQGKDAGINHLRMLYKDMVEKRMRKAEDDAARDNLNQGSMMVPPERQEMPVTIAVGLPTEEPPVDTYDNISPEEKAQNDATMLDDGEMEEEYVDYVAEQVLEPEEQDYLFKVLDADPKLEGILDKVMLSASEFAGSGEVEGPGTGISDSIPARLSDGEFVITRKATDQIGADNLQTMMDDAERAADGSLMGMANGGQAGTNPFVNPEETSNPLDRFEMDKDDERDIERQMLYSSRMPSLMNR
jgi:hypothetical protein